MTVDQSKVIDIVSKDKNGDFVLTICDHLDWHNTKEHLILLQEKINSYMTFLEGGEIYEKYPGARGHRVQIEVMFVHKPNSEALSFLSQAKSIVEEAGFFLRYDRSLSLDSSGEVGGEQCGTM